MLPTLPSSNIWVGNSLGVATAVALTGDATLSNTGVLGVNKTRLNVRNETGTLIAATRAVYVSGFNSDLPLIALADNTIETAHNVIGITTAAISSSTNGVIATSGQFDAETNSWAVGTELYLSTAGVLTAVAPTSGSVRHVAIVTVQQNYPVGKLLIYNYPEENYFAGGIGTDSIIRMGDSAGVNRVSFRNYLNTEVASVTSLGAITGSGISAVSSLLPPLYTTTTRATIISPVNGNLIYNTTQSNLNTYNSTLSAWETVVDSDYVQNVSTLTQAQYDALSGGPVATTLYTISDAQVGGLVSTIANKTTNYTLGINDGTINVLSNNVTISLPYVADIVGRHYRVKNSGTGVVTVSAYSGDTIDGATSYSLYSRYQSVHIQSAGTGWVVL